MNNNSEISNDLTDSDFLTNLDKIIRSNPYVSWAATFAARGKAKTNIIKVSFAYPNNDDLFNNERDYLLDILSSITPVMGIRINKQKEYSIERPLTYKLNEEYMFWAMMNYRIHINCSVPSNMVDDNNLHLFLYIYGMLRGNRFIKKIMNRNSGPSTYKEACVTRIYGNKFMICEYRNMLFKFILLNSNKQKIPFIPQVHKSEKNKDFYIEIGPGLSNLIFGVKK